MSAPIVIQYFHIQGRAEAIRFMLEDQAVAYTEDVDLDSFKANSKDCSQYLFNQLPRVMVGTTVLAQQDAILRYFATVAGKNGSGDILEDTRVSMLACSVEDLASAYTKAIYNPDHANMLVAFATTHSDKVLNQYEHLLKSGGSKEGYFVYSYPSFGEYHLLYIVDCILALRPSALGAFPLLGAWTAQMKARKGIAAYLASGRQREQRNGQPTGQLPLC